jgi:hypothetical protein
MFLTMFTNWFIIIIIIIIKYLTHFEFEILTSYSMVLFNDMLLVYMESNEKLNIWKQNIVVCSKVLCPYLFRDTA